MLSRAVFSRYHFPAAGLLLAITFLGPPLYSLAMAQEAVLEAPAREAAPLSDFGLASIFSDHMVLQRDRTLPIWGTAKAGTTVRIELGDQSKETVTDKDGKWRVHIGPFSTGDPIEMQVSAGEITLTVEDILIGDVWIASGQSNMQWQIANSNDAKREIAAAKWPEIRLMTIPRKPLAKPQGDFDSSGWTDCNPKSSKQFSAVAYFFGRELHKHLNVPIGLISTNYGGTPMEAWTSLAALKSKPNFKYAAKVATDALKTDPKLGKHHPSGLFNAMIHPIIPFSIRGVIWYQGEANARRHQHYHELSELMISDWRERWGQGDFPFLLVQLAGWKPDAATWPGLREAQARTVQTMPNVGMAIATDIGDKKDIHPRNKQAVGKRLSLVARALAYGEDIVDSGPVYRQMTIKDGAVYVEFDHVGSGLQIGKGGLYAQGPKLQGFEIAGSDRKFVSAEAKIENGQVVVTSDEVTAPVAVRYNWSGWTEGTLYNVEGLPAPPFRTNRY